MLSESKVGDHFLGILGIASSKFSSDQHRLVFGIVHHLLVGTIRGSKQVRGNLIPALANVHLNYTVGVDRVALVRVYDNTK